MSHWVIIPRMTKNRPCIRRVMRGSKPARASLDTVAAWGNNLSHYVHKARVRATPGMADASYLSARNRAIGADIASHFARTSEVPLLAEDEATRLSAHLTA
jgi:hypothetical protein